MTNNVLELVQGLTAEQAQEFRQRIYPTLYELRQQIVTGSTPGKPVERVDKGTKQHRQRVSCAGAEGQGVSNN